MDFELEARTKAGERMVELASEHAADFATRAQLHDRENTYVKENFDAMKKSGFLAACAPEQFGGLGVESVHDITVAISRLGRGCGATAISANMHIGAVWLVTRAWQQGVAAGDPAVEEGVALFLPVLGRSQVVLSGAGTESGNSFVFPLTEATPVDGSYRIFTDCFVPEEMMLLGNPLGAFTAEGWPSITAINYPLIGAFLGIAEAARDAIADIAKTRRKRPLTCCWLTGLPPSFKWPRSRSAWRRRGRRWPAPAS